MIDHFEIKAVNFAEGVESYSKVLHPLNIEKKWSEESAAGYGKIEGSKVSFVIEKSDKSTPCHTAFSAPDQTAVDNFYAIGEKNGFDVNGAPGYREHYAPNCYAAFLLDPDGNNIEAPLYL